MIPLRLAIGRLNGLNGPLFMFIGICGMMNEIGKAPGTTTALSVVQPFIALFMAFAGIAMTSSALWILSAEFVSLRKLLEEKTDAQVPSHAQ